MSPSPFLVRPAEAADHDFVLGLAPRFVEFPLPAWRPRDDCLDGIRKDLARHLRERPAGSHIFVAEDRGDGRRVGFVHLVKADDFFDGRPNCHISDLAAAPGEEGRGVGRALLEWAEAWAREQGCRRVTLSVFPGNERARRLYEATGYGVELLRMAKPLD